MFFETTQFMALRYSSSGRLIQGPWWVKGEVRLAEKLLLPLFSITIWLSGLINAEMASEGLYWGRARGLGHSLEEEPKSKAVDAQKGKE